MSLSPQEVHAFAWQEVRNLLAADTSDLALLAGVIAGIITARDGSGFRAAPIPAQEGEERTRSDLVARAVSEAASGAISGRRLPRSAALWEVDSDGKPVESTLALPAELAWVKDPNVQVLGVYKGVPRSVAESRRFMLFAPLDDGFPGPAAYVSGLTRTGLPSTAPQVERRKLLAAWIVGLLSLSAFCLAAGNIHWTGTQIGDGLRLLNGRMVGYGPALDLAFAVDGRKAPAPAFGRECLNAFASAHRPLPTSTAAPEPIKPECLHLWAAAMRVLAPGYLPYMNGKIATGESLRAEIFGWNAPKGDAKRPLNAAWMSIHVPLVIMMLSVVGLAIASGLSLVGRTTGILISDKNRLSLARTQVVAWSVLILPTIIAFACFNAGMVGEAIRLTTTPSGLKLIAEPQFKDFIVFPRFPIEILGALGITVASTMLSAIIVMKKDTGATALEVISGASRRQNDQISTFGNAPSALDKKPSAAEASFGDLLLGEENANKDEVDISRLQMLVITVGLLLTYFNLVLAQASELSVTAVARAFIDKDSLFAALPSAGTTFFAMLALSHSAYLITKSAPKPLAPPEPIPTPPKSPPVP